MGTVVHRRARFSKRYELREECAEGVGVSIDPIGANGRGERAPLFARKWLKSSWKGYSANFAQAAF
jgi:hypothetical protein